MVLLRALLILGRGLPTRGCAISVTCSGEETRAGHDTICPTGTGPDRDTICHIDAAHDTMSPISVQGTRITSSLVFHQFFIDLT